MAKAHRQREVLLGLVLVLAAAGVGFYAYRHYAGRSPDPDNPYVQPALPPGYRPTLKIPLPEVPPGDFRRVLYPRQPSPFVLVKTDLWDVGAAQKVGTVEYKVGPAAVTALRADGKHLAIDGDGQLAVLALPSGQEALLVSYGKGQGGLSFADFPAPDRLAFGRPDGTVEVREVPSGKALGSFKAGRFQPHQAACSPDGTRLAVFDTDRLTVYELPGGKELLSWTTPPRKYKSLLTASGVSFSPDGKELAVLCGLGGPAVLLCWDAAAGKLSGEFAVGPALNTPGAGNLGYGGQVVQWLPGGDGWLLNGHVLYHRRAGRIVWVLRTRAPWTNTVAVLDRDRLLAPVVEGKRETLIDIPVPWAEIDAGLQALAAPGQVPLRPGQPVSVQVDVGALRLAEPEQVQKEVREALAERFAADGVPVGDDQPTVVYARYEEAAGKKLRVYEWAPLQPSQSPPTTAEETKMALEVGIRAKGGTEPLWRTYLSQGAGLIVSGKGTTRDVHRDTLDRLKQGLRNTPFPYFIPAEGNAAKLPLVSQL